MQEAERSVKAGKLAVALPTRCCVQLRQDGTGRIGSGFHSPIDPQQHPNNREVEHFKLSIGIPSLLARLAERIGDEAFARGWGCSARRQTETAMIKIPKKVIERLAAGIKRYQPILADAKSRDLGEADTVRIVTEMLCDVFGYNKFSEITAEYAVRNSFCDLAIMTDDQLQTLVEVKAIGLDLKDHHVKQAIDYGANQGAEWVFLTNGICWRIYRLMFTKPIGQEVVIDVDFLKLSPRTEGDLELLYLWSKEGWRRSVLGEYHSQRKALSRFFVGAILQTKPVLNVIRRELHRVSPDVRIDLDQLNAVLVTEVIKRDALEGEKAEEARRKIARVCGKALRARNSKVTSKRLNSTVDVTASDPPPLPGP
jgi:hypothetical protein